MTSPQCPFCEQDISDHKAGRCLDRFVESFKSPQIHWYEKWECRECTDYLGYKIVQGVMLFIGREALK